MSLALVIVLTLLALTMPFLGIWLLWKKRNHWWGIVLAILCFALFVLALPWLYTVGVLILILLSGSSFGG